MTNDQQAEISERDTQTEAMPTSEQQTTKPEEAKQVADVSQETEPAKTDEGQELPESVKERTTQQFEKLKTQLAEERKRRLELEKSFRQPSQAEQSLPEWYDSTTGEVDVNKLQQREAGLKQELDQMKTQLQGVSRLTEVQQEKEAFASYPELDPSSDSYDDNFQEQVVSYMATAFAKGKAPTLKEAADRVTSIATKIAARAEREGAKKALEQLTPKEQASLEATGRSDRRLPSTDIEQLRSATRRGGRDGLNVAMQRLANISSVGK